jgi:hypothetical protein
MFSEEERRQADLFLADLMGQSAPQTSRRPAGPAVTRVPEVQEDAPTQTDLRSGRVVFYDEDTLRFIEGWTRADGKDRVFVINRGAFDPIRADGTKRGRELDEFLRRHIRGERNLKPPQFVFEDKLHTVPLVPRKSGDWDDLMISQLIAAGRPVAVQTERDQWVLIKQLLAKAVKAAQSTGRLQAAPEFVAMFVLDVSSTATLSLSVVPNIKMNGNHAIIPLGTIRGTNKRVLAGGNANQRVIGDIHTHALLDPFINTTSTSVGTRIGPTLHSGVSDIDVDSARNDGIVVYAIDSRKLHRVDPDGSKHDGMDQTGNLLRAALKIFGGEPR